MSVSKLKKHQDEIPYDMFSREVVQGLSNPIALAIWVYLQSQSDSWEVVESHIREHFNIGRSSYLKAMQELRDCGLYQVIRHKDENNNFTGSHFHIYPVSTWDEDDLPHTWDKDVFPHKYGFPHLRSSTLTEMHTYIKEKENIKEKESAPPKKEFVLPETVDPNVWAEFEQHRREIRKPLTKLSRTKASNLLKVLTPKEQQEVLDISITSGWTGLFPNKIKQQQSGARQSYDKFGGFSKSELDKKARVGEQYEQVVARLQRARP